MGIDFIVAKNRHKNLDDVALVKPLVRNADVVSLEAAALSEKDACEMECAFKLYNTSRNRAKETIKKDITRALVGYDRLIVLLLDLNKPVVPIEVHQDGAAQMINEKFSQIEKSKEHIRHLLSGRYEKALTTVYSNAQNVAELTKIRDLNIVQNAHSVEQRILDIYPKLKGKRNITYLIIIGNLHQIEQGLRSVTNSSVQVHYLAPPEGVPNWYREVIRKVVSENAAFDECKDDMARELLSYAYRVALFGMPQDSLGPLSALVVKNMSINELEVLSSRIKPEMEAADKVNMFREFFKENGIRLPTKPQDYQLLVKMYG